MPTIRPATPADADTVRALAQAAYQRYLPRMDRPPRPLTADYPAAIAAGRVWVALLDERVLGLLVLIDEPDGLLLDNIAVDPSAQGTGIGSALLEFADEQARSRGHRRVRLFTHEAMTENIAYYPRHGYRETHRATEDGFHRVFFVKDLDPTGQEEP